MKRVLFPDDAFDKIRVYSNAFTFHAVPSACVVAGFAETLKLIEATEELVLDLDHLEGCIKEDLASGRFAKGKMILVLSYMRGRVCAGALQQVRDAVIGGLGPRLRVLVRRQDVRLLRGGVDDLQSSQQAREHRRRRHGLHQQRRDAGLLHLLCRQLRGVVEETRGVGTPGGRVPQVQVHRRE
mmetsp:Transcript_97955/g.263216  ORF Transcript_97955/g.263216 Transcript_97955/m.263216 type:complete len:183 (-) Transcript_97955:724-1272(-)